MKKKRFSTEQIVTVLKQAEMGMAVADLIRQIGISEQTFYRWKKQYGGLQSEQVRELKQLTEENAMINRLTLLTTKVRTLTYDNGKEFAEHAAVDKALG